MGKERIIITGITGFAGSHLADKALGFWKDPEIYGFKRETSNLSNIEHIKDRINLIDVDFLDKDSLTKQIAEISPTKVFHLAASTYIPYSFKNPVEVMQANAISTINLFDAIRGSAPTAKVHMCSTSEVYGNVPSEHQPITENTRIFPHNPYAISKTVADLFAYCYYKSYNMNIFTTRAFSYTGPRKGDFFAESSFAKQIALIEKGKKEPVIRVGNLDTVRTFMDVRDVVEAYCILMEKCLPGEVYVISGDSTLTMREVLNRLISFSNVQVKMEVDPALFRPVDIVIQRPDSTKIRKTFGWKPKIPLEKSLKNLLDYWRERV